MGSFFRQWWRLLLAIVMLGAAVHLFVRPPAALRTADPVRAYGVDVFRPVFQGVDLVRQGVSLLWNRYVALVGVTRENERLRAEIVSLRERLKAQQEAVLENRRLKDLLRFAETQDRRTVGARVVGHDVSPWFQAIFIDAGTEEGVEPGMAVVTPAGGVGRVHKVYRGVSEVILLSDGRSAADVIIERSRVRAVAEGTGGNVCRLKYVSPTMDVAVGDRVLFSGFDGSMPKGVLLGTVVSVDRPKESLFLKVQVQCAVNFLSQEEVLVVLARPTIPFRQAQ